MRHAHTPHRWIALVATLTALVAALVAQGAVATPAHAIGFLAGMQADNDLLAPQSQERALSDMRAAGVQIARVTVQWNSIAVNQSCSTETIAALAQPGDGCYNFSALDQLVTLATQNHIKLLFSVWAAPNWVPDGNAAAGSALRAFWVGRTTAQFNTFVANYDAFMHALAARYNAASTFGRVQYWTIWNEPNSKAFWVPWGTTAPAHYGQLVVKASAQIKAANPGSLVAAGPTGPFSTGMKPGQYIPLVAKGIKAAHGSARSIDAWAHNPYPGPGGQAPKTRVYKLPGIGIGNVADLVKTLDSNPITRHKPIWATEFAYNTQNIVDTHGHIATKRVSTTLQADYLADCFAILQGTKRVSVAIWYGLTDGTNRTDWHSGVENASGAHKASYAMYQRMLAPSVTSARRGTVVTLWGHDSIAKGTIVWSANGRTGWRALGGQHRPASGVVTVALRLRSTGYAAVIDAHQRKPLPASVQKIVAR